MPGLLQIDEALERAARLTEWLPSVTPVNVQEERRRFLDAVAAGHRYEPQFHYRRLDVTEADAAIDALRRIDFGVVPQALREEYEETRATLALHLDLMRAFGSGDNSRVGALSRRIYWPKDTAALEEAARHELGSSGTHLQMVQEQSPMVSSADVADALRHALQDLGMRWETVIDDSSAARVRVSSKSRSVHVARDGRFTAADIRKLLVHEIYTHVVRAENGRNLWDFSLYAFGTPDSEMIEEGMALFNEQTEGVARPHQLRLIALHVVGIVTAAQQTFHDTFQVVLPYFGDGREAFDRVLRWKRGVPDQAQPGALWKDVVYFGGLQRVRNYLDSGGTIAALYLGRYDDRRSPAEVSALLSEFGRKDRRAPVIPPFVSVG